MTMGPAGATRAAVYGLGMALRAPGLLAAIVLVTIISAVPFALAIEGPVMDSLAIQPPVSSLSASEVDPEWWQEFRRHAGGLAATFTPAILGFAAPLESVSAVLDGTRRPWALAAPIVVSAIAWALLWGGILHRFSTGRTSLREFSAAAARHFVPMLTITLIAAAAGLVLYLTIHPLLLDVVYGAVSPRMSSERNAFFVRVALYLAFGGMLMTVNAVFSFARVYVVGGDRRVLGAVARGWAFVRGNLWTVTSLYVIFLVIFAAAMIGYGTAEAMGGARVGGWRAVVIGQAFVVFRLGLRLAFSAAQVRLAGTAAPQ
ncbi:MAG TPA: hypothetical protein VEA16_10360 [Vicinamibacterales bacterium]|nr:hypothetical protein [Vicinamibacterales bacterium]